jgi:uncharacterized coiled-coil DUF342 family protein
VTNEVARSLADQLQGALTEIDRLAGDARRATLHAEHQAQLQCEEHATRLLAEAEVERLTTRRDELLALVRKLTRETPYPAELDECRSARAALIAEVGTLRANAAEREITLEAARVRIRELEEGYSSLVEECEERTENPGGDFYSEHRELLAKGVVQL